jgi:hypothetical protein
LVKVYQIKVWDQPSGRWIFEHGKFTKEALLEIPEALIVPDEDEEVEHSLLDENGRYLPQQRSQSRK